jgi:hypothetical protein
MIDELAIRRAIEAIADEARPSDRIRATLDRRVHRHRQRRLVLRLAGVGAAGAVVGLAGVRIPNLFEDDHRFPQVVGGPGGGWLEAPLRWRPAWLPTGYGQSILSAVIAGDAADVVSRTWADPASAKDGVAPTIALTVGWSDLYAGQPAVSHTTTVQINGVQGTLTEHTSQGSGNTRLQWQPPGEAKLTLSVDSHRDPDQRRDVALRVARSLVPDPSSLPIGPRLGWLPADLATTPWMLTITYEAVNWCQSLAIRLPDGTELDISMGPAVRLDTLPTDATKRISVHGVDARYATPDPDQLELTMPDGVKVWMQLDRRHADTTPDDLVKIAEQLDVGPWPDMNWVGTR